MLLGGAFPSWAAPGDPIGPEFQVNTYTTSVQHQPVVGPTAEGGFVVVWRSNGGDVPDPAGSIQGQRYDALGVPVGSQFQINTYTTGNQGDVNVAPIANGGLVVVWESGGSGSDPSPTVLGQRLDATGVPVGGEFQLNTYTTGEQYSPVAAPTGSGFVVVWNSVGGFGDDTDNVGIQAQRYDASGVPLGGQFQVNTYTTDGQYDATVGPDGAGGFVVAWTSKFGDGTDTSVRSVQARRFDGGGVPLGGQFQVNTYTTNAQGYPAVTSMSAGGFVVVWLSSGSAGADTSQSSVHAQRFDAGGSPVGGEFEVNTYTTGTQRSPAVGVDGAGGFVVLWASYEGTGNDTDALSVQARRFDATGAPLGGEFQVNSYTTGDQVAYGVSPAGGGDFVVVWASLGGDGNDVDNSIQARRFEGPEIVSTTTSSLPGATTTTTIPPFAGEGLTGQKLELRTKGGRLDRARLAMRSADSGLTLGRGNGSADDPVANGGALTVLSGGTAVRHTLAGGWRHVGRAGRNKGYKWKSKSSPIRAIAIRPGKLVKIAGRGALGVDLADDPRPVRLELGIGAHLYCFEFGGRLVDIRLSERLLATQAPAPPRCP
jgi:hypothetical protein